MTGTAKEYAATKVLAKAGTWYDRRQATQAATVAQKARAAGRYEESGDELAAAVEEYRRKAGEAER